jgi:nitrite reductase (NADH) small subunit
MSAINTDRRPEARNQNPETPAAAPWTTICRLRDILPNTGVCALVEGVQIAVFRYGDGEQLHALGNFDPIGKAFVLSRGMVGNAGEVPFVASPLYKQRYDLRSGACLDDAGARVPAFPVRLDGELVQIRATPRRLSAP